MKVGVLNFCHILLWITIELILGGQKATMRDIFMMFSAMRQGSRMIDICLRFNPASLNINERNLVLYGLSNGYIRQLRKANKLFLIQLKYLKILV